MTVGDVQRIVEAIEAVGFIIVIVLMFHAAIIAMAISSRD